MEATIPEENNYNLVYHSLRDIGCCQMCCLRFLGEKTESSFLNLDRTIAARKIKLEESPPSPQNKVQKPNVCVACLGLLQKPYCHNIVESIIKDLLKEDYDCDTFNIALTLPVSFQLRAHSMFLHIESKFPTFSNFHFQLGVVTVSVKDVWKWQYTNLISKTINKVYSTESEYTVTFSLKYADEENECTSLFAMFPEKANSTKNRKNKGGTENFSRKQAETCLRMIKSERFSTFYPVPPCIPNSEVIYMSCTTLHGSVYIAGRYNKYSRVLPQTPWVINGERKLEGSVEELISEPMKEVIKAHDTRFAASGREDIDVRTLGRGRPFYIELIDPHRIKLDYESMRNLENTINANANKLIFVKDLQFVDKSELDIMKSGEESKSKEYRALCLLLDPSAREKCNEKLKDLSSLFPLTLKQATPLRVLHRRPVAVRERTVNWLSAGPLHEDKDVFVISLNTEAGTYIKEFVHGDFGRTRPCLGELLGGIEVDILSLDVMDVVLDWPPSINYKS